MLVPVGYIKQWIVPQLLAQLAINDGGKELQSYVIKSLKNWAVRRRLVAGQGACVGGCCACNRRGGGGNVICLGERHC